MAITVAGTNHAQSICCALLLFSISLQDQPPYEMAWVHISSLLAFNLGILLLLREQPLDHFHALTKATE